MHTKYTMYHVPAQRPIINNNNNCHKLHCIINKFNTGWQAPLYSGKQMASGDVRILSANKSFLLRKRITDVSMNQRLLQIESNNFILSAIRFYQSKQRIWEHQLFLWQTNGSYTAKQGMSALNWRRELNRNQWKQQSKLSSNSNSIIK